MMWFNQFELLNIHKFLFQTHISDFIISNTLFREHIIDTISLWHSWYHSPIRLHYHDSRWHPWRLLEITSCIPYYFQWNSPNLWRTSNYSNWAIPAIGPSWKSLDFTSHMAGIWGLLNHIMIAIWQLLGYEQGYWGLVWSVQSQIKIF